MLYDDQRGEIICSECGLVANSAMCSQEPEWRAYNAEEVKTKSRVGLPTSLLNNQFKIEQRVILKMLYLS
jgi:transcription initiation factor TFIIB